MQTARRRFYDELMARWRPCDDDEDAGDPARYLVIHQDLFGAGRFWFVTLPDLCFIKPHLSRHARDGWRLHCIYDLDTRRELDLAAFFGVA